MSNVNKKQILLQVYNFIYFYYGLSAIKTLFGNNFVVDILLISDDKEIELHNKYAKSFSYVKNIHILSSDFSQQIRGFLKKTSFISSLIFNFCNKNIIIKKLKYFFAKQEYDEVFFCHENRNFNISVIKLCYPNANFTMYGDGFGLFCSATFDYYKNINFKNPYIIDEICPDRVIGLLPCDVDDIVSHRSIPVFTTNKHIMKNFLKEPKEIKLLVDDYTQYISKLNGEICLFMTSCLAEVSAMSLNEEIDMNIEIIRKNLPLKTIILIKPHPREQGTKVKLYKEILKDNYTILELPKNLQKIPVELMGSLLEKVKYLITYGTSFVTLKYLYDIEHIDISKIVSKYNYRQSNEIFDEVYKRLTTYSGEGLIYSKKFTHP